MPAACAGDIGSNPILATSPGKGMLSVSVEKSRQGAVPGVKKKNVYKRVVGSSAEQ